MLPSTKCIWKHWVILLWLFSVAFSSLIHLKPYWDFACPQIESMHCSLCFGKRFFKDSPIYLFSLDRRLIFYICLLRLLHSRGESHKCIYGRQLQSHGSRKAKGSESMCTEGSTCSLYESLPCSLSFCLHISFVFVNVGCLSFLLFIYLRELLWESLFFFYGHD